MLKVTSEKLKFDPVELFSEKWNDEVHKAQDRCNIHFDLENNDSVGDIRRLSFPNGRTDPTTEKPDEDVFYVQLCSAGGDWESPVYYFRIQIKDGYPRRRLFVFIPSKEEGNGLLRKKEKGGYAPLDADDYDPDGRDEKKCWDAVKRFLKEHSLKDIDDQIESLK